MAEITIGIPDKAIKIAAVVAGAIASPYLRSTLVVRLFSSSL